MDHLAVPTGTAESLAEALPPLPALEAMTERVEVWGLMKDYALSALLKERERVSQICANQIEIYEQKIDQAYAAASRTGLNFDERIERFEHYKDAAENLTGCIAAAIRSPAKEGE